jgi:hypothetical protein
MRFLSNRRLALAAAALGFGALFAGEPRPAAPDSFRRRHRRARSSRLELGQ